MLEGMESYTCAAEVKAKPMTRGDYNKYRGWNLPADETPADEGFIVERQDGSESWVPKELFLDTHSVSGVMAFGSAIEVLKTGGKVAREGWNGKGIFIYILRGMGEMTNPYIAIDTTGLQTNNPAAPKCCVPWAPSQTDMLAEDWTVVR